jgi:hypothetical protein
MKYNNSVSRRTNWQFVLQIGKEPLDKGIRAVRGLLKDGAKTLIEAAVRGAGEAMVKGG